MFVTVTRIEGEKLDRAAEGFRRGAPDLKRFPGFLGFELWRSEGVLEAVARWESRAAMEAYAHSDEFRAHHGHAAGEGHGQPEGHDQPEGHGAQGGAGARGGGQVEYFDAERVV